MELKKMRLSGICISLALLSFAPAAKAQEIPPDVNYKRATNEINAAAKSTLESALASQAAPNDFLGGVFICGPLLWRVLKPAADQALLAGKPLVAIIQNPEVIHAQARNFLKPEEKQLFWKLLREKYPGLSSGEVRKAHADETLPLLRLPARTNDLADIERAAARLRAGATDVVVLGTGG